VNRRRSFIVVSNRLPVTLENAENGIRFKQSGGGLVTALVPILEQNGGCWIGWPGPSYDESQAPELQKWSASAKYALEPVFLTPSEQECFYRGFSNEIIWPLFHGFQSRCSFDSEYWESYCSVNAKFAAGVANVSAGGNLIWVHDYHLMMLADALRVRSSHQSLGYFHHIPFPPPDVFEILPWRARILRGLTRYDVIGFQTVRDQRNFVACLRQCLPGVRVHRSDDKFVISMDNRFSTVGVYPIGIDDQSFADEAGHSAVIAESEAIKESVGRTQIILGVDRLDYTKGVVQRLVAFKSLLEHHPEFRERISFVQIVVPSRENIAEYKHLKTAIENIVSNINGEYTSRNWVPVRYLYRSISRSELAAYYSAADVAFVTPLKDGMNLIAKEFCASRTDNRGVLVLSEFAGAAEELKRGALLVNPHDMQKVVSVLRRALSLGQNEQQLRMRNMRTYLRSNDVFRWARSFVGDCSGVAHTAAASAGVSEIAAPATLMKMYSSRR